MSIRSRVEEIGGCALGIVAIIAMVAVPAILVVGAVWVAETILPWLLLICMLSLGVCIVILGPLALMPWTRACAGTCYFIASYVFGLTAWLMGLLLTWTLWGGWAVAIGLIVLGIGVVPMALLATLLNGMWVDLGVLVLAVLLTFGFRILGAYLAENAKEAKAESAL
jgi:hypothetical protein